MSGRSTQAIDHDVDRLRSLDAAALRQEWRRLYRAEPPKLSRDLLLLGLAYRLQEQEHRGLSRAVDRKLRSMATLLSTTGKVQQAPRVNLKAGARLVREWHGRTHTVVVTAGGFEYGERSYSSLSEIARQITGARWSGPRFFAPTQRSRVCARG